jgi:hypothetical protein
MIQFTELIPEDEQMAQAKAEHALVLDIYAITEFVRISRQDIQ